MNQIISYLLASWLSLKLAPPGRLSAPMNALYLPEIIEFLTNASGKSGWVSQLVHFRDSTTLHSIKSNLNGCHKGFTTPHPFPFRLDHALVEHTMVKFPDAPRLFLPKKLPKSGVSFLWYFDPTVANEEAHIWPPLSFVNGHRMPMPSLKTADLRVRLGSFKTTADSSHSSGSAHVHLSARSQFKRKRCQASSLTSERRS